MWSSAAYKGKLFMGHNNGGRGKVLAIRVGCLSLKRLILLSVATDGDGARSWGIANVHVYDGDVQKVVYPFLRSNNIKVFSARC
jgi:hypothetical protein